ncbi:sensor histidine kinase [Streptomyces rectiverticillatus]|uniref:sensor histidine kinase n=1 Tax=Streptomyces rectiverticillatus TaxID=173860 RepID=UPI0015C3E9A2|nr:histidine kinase [Streptomyces rectiverticillatus]QLE74729.1 sensor histidine kinase [Streptomyces rectiverticillatus]
MIARLLLPRHAAVRRSVLLQDFGIALAVLAVQSVLFVVTTRRSPDLPGWALLTGAALVLTARRRAPWLTVLAVACMNGPFYALGYPRTAVLPAGLVALCTLAVVGPPKRSFLTLGGIFGVATAVLLAFGKGHEIVPTLVSAGWIADVVLIGEAVRLHRNYVGAIMERAERAEAMREREAARRVAEERVHIARDLHDLLAHSITLIGVQTAVAAHVLVADPERLDRAALAKALDGIADTCRDARAELRATLEVLRGNDSAGYGPLPGLDGLPDLARAAEAAGARVSLQVHMGPDPQGGTAGSNGAGPGSAAHSTADPAATAFPAPAVGAAAYRIVQEALTNAVRHGGPSVRVWVTVARGEEDGALRVTVLDDGGSGAPARDPVPGNEPNGTGGYGIVGMRERARSVGGGLQAGPRAGGTGFAVTAVLPSAPADGTALR